MWALFRHIGKGRLGIPELFETREALKQELHNRSRIELANPAPGLYKPEMVLDGQYDIYELDVQNAINLKSQVKDEVPDLLFLTVGSEKNPPEDMCMYGMEDAYTYYGVVLEPDDHNIWRAIACSCPSFTFHTDYAYCKHMMEWEVNVVEIREDVHRVQHQK